MIKHLINVNKGAWRLSIKDVRSEGGGGVFMQKFTRGRLRIWDFFLWMSFMKGP